jgi:hypothetical protein
MMEYIANSVNLMSRLFKANLVLFVTAVFFYFFSYILIEEAHAQYNVDYPEAINGVVITEDLGGIRFVNAPLACNSSYTGVSILGPSIWWNCNFDTASDGSGHWDSDGFLQGEIATYTLVPPSSGPYAGVYDCASTTWSVLDRRTNTIFASGSGCTASWTMPDDAFNWQFGVTHIMGRSSSPIGFIDPPNMCEPVPGWTCDSDDYNVPLEAHLYFDGPAGVGSGAYGTTANLSRADVASSCGGNPNHGFYYDPPASFDDGNPHDVYGYGINIGAGNNSLLSGSPRVYQCLGSPDEDELDYTCNPGGTITVFWSADPTADFYSLRFDEVSNGWSGSCTEPLPNDFCYDTPSRTTSYTFTPSSPSAIYRWWMHSRSSENGAWGTAVAGPYINCSAKGYHDAVNCIVSDPFNSYSTGWACDGDDYSVPLTVNHYFALLNADDRIVSIEDPISISADLTRSDIAGQCGGYTNHGFRWIIPGQFINGNPYQVFTTGINLGVGNNEFWLPNTPRDFQCFAPLDNLQHVCNGDGTVTLSWDSLGLNNNYYAIRVNDPTLTNPWIEVDDVPSTTYNTPVVTPGVLYEWWIYPRSSVNNVWGPESAHAFFTCDQSCNSGDICVDNPPDPGECIIGTTYELGACSSGRVCCEPGIPPSTNDCDPDVCVSLGTCPGTESERGACLFSMGLACCAPIPVPAGYHPLCPIQ